MHSWSMRDNYLFIRGHKNSVLLTSSEMILTVIIKITLFCDIRIIPYSLGCTSDVSEESAASMFRKQR
jgi:hypothetical protein